MKRKTRRAALVAALTGAVLSLVAVMLPARLAADSRRLIPDVTLIDQDGAPQGARSFVLWNPPLLDERRKTRGEGQFGSLGSFAVRPLPEGGRRRSTNIETANLLAITLCMLAKKAVRQRHDVFPSIAQRRQFDLNCI